MLWEGGYIVFRVKLAQKLTRSLKQYHLASLHHAESSKWLCMELVQAWHGWLGEEVKSLIYMAWYLIELSLSMSLLCFPAALLVQGIIAKSQNGANAESQHGSGAVPNLIRAARLGTWDRHSWMALFESPGVYLPCWLCSHNSCQLSMSHACSILLNISGIPILVTCGQLMLNSFMKQGWVSGDTYWLIMGKEMLLLSENVNFWLKYVYLLSVSILLV